jgi:hypothetical protein
LGGRKEFVVWAIPGEIVKFALTEGVVDVSPNKILDVKVILSNPSDERHERNPNRTGSAITKGIPSVNTALVVESNDLFELPVRVNGEKSVRFCYVGFPHGEMRGRVPLSETNQAVAEVDHVVEWRWRDVVLVDHAVE